MPLVWTTSNALQIHTYLVSTLRWSVIIIPSSLHLHDDNCGAWSLPPSSATRVGLGGNGFIAACTPSMHHPLLALSLLVNMKMAIINHGSLHCKVQLNVSTSTSSTTSGSRSLIAIAMAGHCNLLVASCYWRWQWLVIATRFQLVVIISLLGRSLRARQQ
jgi:hypothetical protein